MPIYSADIKTRQAAVADQYDNSGGRIHPTAYVEHNQVGSLFPKLTEVDHAGGRVDLTKCFLSIESAGAEQGDDCYSYLDQSPADPLVDCVLLRPVGVGVRSGHTNTRADTRAYVEGYQIASGQAPWYLRGRHVQGMSHLVLWCLEAVRLPEVGSTLYLSANEGASNAYGQYVQIADFRYETQSFLSSTNNGVDVLYTRRIIYLTLTSGLTADFTGPEVGQATTGLVLIRETMVADGSRYYGRSALAAAVSAGASAVQVASIYAQVAPCARGERALVALDALAAGAQTIMSGGQSFSVSGPVHTGRVAVTTGNRRTLWTRPLWPIPATGGAARAYVRILDRWYSVVEGESNTVGSLTVNRTDGSSLLALTALPDAGTWVIWEWPSGIHFTDRAGTTAVHPLRLQITLPSVPETGTLTLTWTSGGVTRTATEATPGGLSGHATGWRVGTQVVLILSTYLPDANATVLYSYQPVSTVTESLTPTVSGGVGTVTLAALPRAGSLTVTWTVRRVTSATNKDQYVYVADNTDGWAVIPLALGSTSSSATEVLLTKSAADDGAGAILTTGTVSYTTGAVALPLLSSYSANSYTIDTQSYGIGSPEPGTYETGSWGASSQLETLEGAVTVRYALAASAPGEVINGSVSVPPLEVELLGQSSQDQLVPGTLRFSLGGRAYSDRDGAGGLLYWADGTVVGSVDYNARCVSVTNWAGATPSIAITSLISTWGQFTCKELAFRTAAAPLAPGSLSLSATAESGTAVTGSGGTDGALTGTGIVTGGTVEHAIGVVACSFDTPVYPASITYSASAFTVVPLDPAIIGLDPVRLPPDGRVPKIRAGDYAVVYEDGVTTMANPVVAGETYSLPPQGLAFAYLEDGAGEQSYTCPGGLAALQVIQIPRASRTGPLEYAVLEDAKARPIAGALYQADLTLWQITLPATFSAEGYDQPFVARFLPLVSPNAYTVDRTAGHVTMVSALSTHTAGYTQPLKARWRIHDLTLVVEAQTTGTITLQSALTHDYTTAAGISAMLLHGNLVARVANGFEQHTFGGTWLDYLSGSAPTGGARYDWTGYPVAVTNKGAIRERWQLRKRSDGAWDVVGETLGVIQVWPGTGTLNAVRSSSQAYPYFVLYAAGLGANWVTGNFIQFETYSAQGPMWALRTVRPGAPSVTVDAVRLRHRVGAD
ncbi:hypothetical protein [uncultured Thiodictyon sp.]|uniref:hypothetical protein n=1 Tax=uncultured Thiodictyon sp. TaxID=1846217 RepID=UPI0025F29590|nr:hypothetical protein [uncultured Thiodictyon sp.]